VVSNVSSNYVSDCRDWPKVEEELRLIVDLLVAEFIQPEKYGLRPRSD
jgi:hypothetical protein